MEEIIDNKDIVVKKANTVVNRLQKIYLVITCIAAIVSIYGISEGITDYSPQAAAAFIVYFTIYVGLRRRKKWAFPIILIYSAFALLTSFLSSLVPAKDVGSLTGKVIDILIVLFSAYQLHIFSKKEVKELFNAKGTIIY